VASLNVTLAGRPPFKAIVMRTHEASGTIEILGASRDADDALPLG
jgi:hypothetical protein